MYQDDEYILVDGDKRACVHPTNGVKQGCPLSPLLVLYTLMTWAEVAGICNEKRGNNTSKSEVMHLSSRLCSSLPTFMYGDVALPEKDQFRYLGMLVDKRMNLKVSEEHAVQPYMASQQRT
eukprot:72102-Pelagomonas_calceolata.AAC.1